MTGEIGHLALTPSLVLALIQAGAGLVGARPDAPRARGVASGAAIGFFVFVALAFACLTYASVTSDFSLLNVAENSNTAKPLLYKITGVWGDHPGSMLLCILGLGSYAADSIQALDTPAIIGVTLFIALVYVAANLLVDVVQATLDPRIRLA